MKKISLRGGGSACSDIKDSRQNIIHPKMENDTQMIEMFIKNVSQRCENILKRSLKIGLQESKDGIIQEIKWFQLSSQYLNQISRQTQMVQENIQLVFINLEILLQAILNMVQSQSFLSYHLLKICNLFSQQIFIYYIYSPNPPMKQEKQNIYQNLLAEIEKYIEFGGQGFYQNSIIYEFEVIKMCINICPNDSTKGQEILMNTFKGILESATKMSPSTELVTALLDGALYVYQKIIQQSQNKIFQVIFYLEQLKWAIIEKIQNGITINSVRQSLVDNYMKLINQQNQWIIKCSWIKFISEILQYIPIITKEKYQKMKSRYMLNQDWIKLIEQKLINAIDENKNIGVISNIDSGDQVARIFKTQFIVLDQLRNICLNGYQDIPKFDIFVNQQQIEISQGEKQEQFVKILEYIDNLQIPQLQNMYRSFQQNFLEYLQTWNSLSEDQLDTVQYQCQVQQQIVQSQQLDSQIQNLTLNGKIINKQLECLMDTSEINLQNVDNINQKLFYSLIYNYFIVIQTIENQNQDILENYQGFVKSFPEIQLKEIIKVQDQKKKFQDDINQSQIKEQITVISLLYEKIHRIQLLKTNSILKIQYYTGILNQFVNVQVDFRKDLRMQQNKFYFIEQTIIATNQIAKDNNSQKMKEFYVYFAIISQMMLIYEELSDLLSDLNLSEQEIKNFKFLNIAEIVSIFNTAIESEIQYLSNQQNEQQLNSQDNQSTEQQLQRMLITIQTQKQIQNKKNEEVQIFINKIQVYKSIFQNNLEIQSNQEQSYQNLLIQSVQSLKQLIENGNQRQDLINILEQRRNVLLKVQLEQKDNQILYNQIQKEIQYTQIVNQEQFYEFIEKKIEQFYSKLNQSNQIIINCLEQKEENQTSDNNQIILQFIEILDKLNHQMDQSLKSFGMSELLRTQNEVIFDISTQLFQIEYISENTLNDVQGKFKSIIESISKIQILDETKIKSLIDKNSHLISSLPQNSDSKYQFLVIDKELLQKTTGDVLKEQSKSFHQRLDELIIGESWRYKEFFYFCCLSTYQVIKNKAIKQHLGKIILLGKFKETDFRIRSTLKNKEYQLQLEQLVNNEWQSSQENIYDSLQKTLNELQSIQLQLQGEERKQQRDNLIQKHKELESQLEQQMRNVNEIGDILGITVNFLKDIKKELLLIQSKLDNIIGSLEQIGQDIKFLRGKTPQQLLEIRMEQVLQNKYVQDSQSVYVQILVKEYNFQKNKENEQTHLFNYEQYQDGEIDEFLQQNDMVSLLIHGPAGSGKSITARKLEEYLWIQYKKQINSQVWNQQSSLKIPIFIQLPILKEPQFTAIEETLLSSIYQFDQKQINQLLDQIQNTKIKLIFIMDSYDELSTQFQGTNLIQTNKLYQWKQKNESKHPKVITTSRSEIFANSEYRSWFKENDQISFKSYKEIRLQPFNQQQRQEFLFTFSQLQLKLQIKDLLEIVSKQQSQDNLIQDTLQIYDQLQINHSQQKEYLLNQTQIKKLINIIKQHPNVININSDQEISFSKQLLIIWSADQYSQSILQMELQGILDTPFMLNIVVQVLPQMAEILSSQNYIKDSFKSSYINQKRNQIQSIVNRYRSQNQFIMDRYLPQDIDELQKIIDDKTNVKIKNEANQIWNVLIDSNFFKDFNIILQYQEIIKLLENLGQIKALINNKKILKERDIDNLVPIYKALTSKKSTIYEFYQFFYLNYIEKQRIKLIYNNDILEQNQFVLDIESYGEKLALAMTQQNVTTVEIKPKGILFKTQGETNPFDQFFDDQDQYAKYRKLIRKCLPLKQKANFYSFNHKTIQEYLFAKNIVEFICNIDKDLDKIIQTGIQNNTKVSLLEKIENSSLNQVNLGEISMIGAFKFIRIAIQGNLESQEVCYKLSRLSSIFPSLIKMSSNSLYILVNVKQIIKKRDFSNINIADISLNGSYFKKCNFSDSRFERVNLNGIHLQKTDLSRIDWKDIYTNDLPVYQADNQVYNVCYSLDGQKIIGCGQKGWIWIWDKQSRELIKKLQCYHGEVYYVKEIQNNQILSLGKDEEIYVIKLWDNEFNQLNSSDMIFINERIWKVGIIEQFTHNNLYIGTLDQNRINIYNMDSKLLVQWDLVQNSHKIQIKDNHDFIYTVSIENWTITIWDFNKIQVQIIQLPKLSVDKHNWLIKFSDDLQFLLLAQKRQLWSINLQKQQLYEDNQQYQQLYISLSNPIDNLTITSDNLYLAISDYEVLYIYDAETFFLLSVPHEGHYNEITSIGFDTKQTEIITTSKDYTARLWDFKILLQKSVQNQSEKFNKISTIQYSPDGMLIYYCQIWKDSLYIVSVQTGEQTDQINFKFKGFNVCITGRYIYFIDSKKSFVQYEINTKTFSEMVSLHQVYDIDTIQQSQNYRLFQLVDSAGGREYHAHSYQVLLNDKAWFQSIIRMEFTLQIQFSHNTNYLYYLSYKESKTIKTMQISIQDIEDKFLKKLDNPQFKHSDSIHSFVLKSDDKQIISFYTSLDETKLFVWDIQSKELHLQLDFGCWGFILSKTLNQYLILFNRNKIFFYDTETYQQVGSSSNINYDMIACCPNRYQFITIEGKNSIKLWNIDKEKLSQNIYVFNEGLVIPNYSMQGTLLDNVKWDNSKIISHLKFDLQNIWSQKGN